MNKTVFKTKLSNIATVLQGQSPESKYYSTIDGTPFLQGNRTFGNLFPTFDTYTKKITKLAKKGEVLMSVRAPVGDLNFAPCDLCIGRGLASIKAKNGDNKFVYYALKYNVMNLLKQGAATTFDSVNKDIINDFVLIIPEDELSRTKVSAVLSVIDEKIELNNKINTKLETMAKTIFDYWFVQFNFPNEKGKPYKSCGGKMVWNEELKRDIPEGWEIKKLGELGEFKNGINYDPSIKGNTESKIINVRNISSSTWFISQYELDTIILDKKDVDNYLVTENDIIIARSGIPGATRMMYEYEPNTIYCGFIIRYQVNCLENKNYLFFCLKNLESSTTSKSAGTIMQNVNQDTLKRMDLVMPDKTLISNFNRLIYPIFQNLNNNLKENQQLSELRDWLLPMLMNGQVTVN